MEKLSDYMEVPIMDYVMMDGFREKDIDEDTNGEVFWMSGTKEGFAGTSTDPDIFGDEPDEMCNLIGHITLPIPVVNIRFFGKVNPQGFKELSEFDREVVDAIIHGETGVIMKIDEENRWKVDQLVSMDDCIDGDFDLDGDEYFMYGGEAIEKLLGDCYEHDMMIMRKIPVIPIAYRTDGKKVAKDVQKAYDDLIEKVVYYNAFHDRFPDTFTEWSAGNAIQRAVNTLIDNGGDGRIAVDERGIPLDTLNELAHEYGNVDDEVRKEKPAKFRFPGNLGEIRNAVGRFKRTENDEDHSLEYFGLKCEIVQLLQPLIEDIGKTYFTEGWMENPGAFISCSSDALRESLNGSMKTRSMNEIISGFADCVFENMEFYNRKMIERKEEDWGV